MAEFGGRDERLALELAKGETVRDAAVSAGVSERTASRRLTDIKFRRFVLKLRAEILERALSEMFHACTDAARTLRDLLANEDPKVKMGAAKAILETALKGRSLEIAEDLEELRNKISELIEHQQDLDNKRLAG